MGKKEVILDTSVDTEEMFVPEMPATQEEPVDNKGAISCLKNEKIIV